MSKLILSIAGVLIQIQSCLSKVVLYSGEGISYEFYDVPAAFGQSFPKEGFTGNLVLAAPDIFACSELNINVTHSETNESIPLIVLASRSYPNDPEACSFTTKMLNVHKAGGKALVVYDFLEEAMFRMLPDTSKTENINLGSIPLTLVSLKAGELMVDVLSSSASDHKASIYISGGDPYYGPYRSLNSALLGFVSCFLVMSLVCGAVFLLNVLHSRSRPALARIASRPILTNRSLTKLCPEKKIQNGSAFLGETCVVCLDEFKIGDVFRRLPCQHMFHSRCIAPWLTERQSCCPLCKKDVEQAPSNSTEEQSQLLAPLIMSETSISDVENV